MLTSVVQLEAKKGIHMTLRDTVTHKSGLKHTDTWCMLAYIQGYVYICHALPHIQLRTDSLVSHSRHTAGAISYAHCRFS